MLRNISIIILIKMILRKNYFKCVITIFVSSIIIPHEILATVVKIKIQIKFFSYHLT